MAFKMRGITPLKQTKTEGKFEKWIEGSEKTGKFMLERAKKKCAEKGGVWKDGECVTETKQQSGDSGVQKEQTSELGKVVKKYLKIK
jgi:hypothetical protein|tara:strand:+ start:93 stop:353 length:261 start_codon:yes stop_codon:yes gene_type:complete